MEWGTFTWGMLATPAFLMKSLQADALTFWKWCLNETCWMGLQRWFKAVRVHLLWLAAASWWFWVQKGHMPPLLTHKNTQTWWQILAKFTSSIHRIFLFQKRVKTVQSQYLDACSSCHYLSIRHNSLLKLFWGNILYSDVHKVAAAGGPGVVISNLWAFS